LNRLVVVTVGATALALLALVHPGPAAAYDTADLLGRWTSHGLASGPGAPWWERARVTFAANGDFTATTLTNLGEADTIQAAMTVGPTGVISIPGSSTMRGALDIGRTVFATTDTWGAGAAGTTELKLVLKSAGAYALADLAGGWELHSIVSGPGAPWWMRGRLAMAADGSFTGTLTEIGGSPEPVSGAFGVTPDGVVSLSVAAAASGSLDAGRTVMALTNTWSGFMAGTTELSVLVKMAASYAQADLAGTWELQSLATGPGAPWWNRATISVAPDGSFAGTSVDSDGSSQPTSGTLVLAPNGVLTRSGSPTARGALDAGRSVMLWTDTWATGAPGTTEILFAVRTGGSTADAPMVEPSALSLDSVRPHPVRGGRPHVRFRLATGAAARLELFDLGGRVVAARDVGALGAGQHDVTLGDGARLVPGLYWLRLTQGARSHAMRVAVL
jgi:hypothetical protein